MKILITRAGYIVACANSFSFGAWDEQDTIYGLVVRKWKAEDKNGNLIGYYIDDNERAVTGAEIPYFKVVEVAALPVDWMTDKKYIYQDDTVIDNPDWTEPEPTLEERVSALENYSADLLYQVCLLQLGITEDEL